MSKFNIARLQQYATYNDCVEVKICNKEGKVIRQKFLGNVHIDCDKPLRIAFDQSSSQTGIAVKKNNGEFVCLIDIINSSYINYNLYKAMLGLKIEQIFNSSTVEMCIVEKMWGGNKTAYEMLSELGSFISGFKYILEGWRNAEVSEILPNVWRSAYLKDPKYKGQFTKDKVKVAALKEGIARYPQLHNYGMFYKEGNHVNDSFDALGILEGYEEKTFSADGSMRKVANTMSPTNHAYSYKAFICEDLTDLKETIISECPERTAIEYEYNDAFPFHENIRRATSVTNKIVYMRVDSSVTKIQLMWRYGVTMEKDDLVYIVGWRDRISTKLGNY